MLYSSVEVHDISEEYTASILMVKKCAKPNKKKRTGENVAASRVSHMRAQFKHRPEDEPRGNQWD